MKDYNWNFLEMNLQEHFRSQSAKEAKNLSRFSSLGTSDQGNTQEDNEIADEVATKMTKTTTGEEDNLIVSSSKLKEMWKNILFVVLVWKRMIWQL
eukprot:15067716-Ditylum_brightwellii.AAC.1